LPLFDGQRAGDAGQVAVQGGGGGTHRDCVVAGAGVKGRVGRDVLSSLAPNASREFSEGCSSAGHN
jgi:hypothetical protein